MGIKVVQAVPAARVLHPIPELGRLVGHLLDHLRCLLPDELPIQEGTARSSSSSQKVSMLAAYFNQSITVAAHQEGN